MPPRLYAIGKLCEVRTWTLDGTASACAEGSALCYPLSPSGPTWAAGIRRFQRPHRTPIPLGSPRGDRGGSSARGPHANLLRVRRQHEGWTMARSDRRIGRRPDRVRPACVQGDPGHSATACHRHGLEQVDIADMASELRQKANKDRARPLWPQACLSPPAGAIWIT